MLRRVMAVLIHHHDAVEPRQHRKPCRIDFGLGVSLAHTYEIKKSDNDYFEEG